MLEVMCRPSSSAEVPVRSYSNLFLGHLSWQCGHTQHHDYLEQLSPGIHGVEKGHRTVKVPCEHFVGDCAAVSDTACLLLCCTRTPPATKCIRSQTPTRWVTQSDVNLPALGKFHPGTAPSTAVVAVTQTDSDMPYNPNLYNILNF